MQWKKMAATGLTVLVMALTSCGVSSSENQGKNQTAVTYFDINLGEDYREMEAELSLLTNRVDMLDKQYEGITWEKYMEEFHKEYPKVKVKVEGITDYAGEASKRLQEKNWGDIMMIPEIDKSKLPEYFLSYGKAEVVGQVVKYPARWLYGGEVYGIPSTVIGRGIIYNKRIFRKAGIEKIPKTPEEFINALKAVRDRTDVKAALYTNYADGWAMGAWDDYIGGTATGDEQYMNQKLLHSKNPFSDPGDGTGAYHVYKILYDAVKLGLTEKNYQDTDWEKSKKMLNNGEIGCMVLGAWAYPQIQKAGENAGDVAYMPFPITVKDRQYSAAAADYCYGINVNASPEHQTAAMVFVKWMTEKSGYSYNEGGLPLAVEDESYSQAYDSFLENHVEFLADKSAVEGEEELLNDLNTSSGLMITAGGDKKVQDIVESAHKQDKSFDEIMEEWNQKWSDAQEKNGIVTE